MAGNDDADTWRCHGTFDLISERFFYARPIATTLLA
jgi:hypothetical protein